MQGMQELLAAINLMFFVAGAFIRGGKAAAAIYTKYLTNLLGLRRHTYCLVCCE